MYVLYSFVGFFFLHHKCIKYSIKKMPLDLPHNFKLYHLAYSLSEVSRREKKEEVVPWQGIYVTCSRSDGGRHVSNR